MDPNKDLPQPSQAESQIETSQSGKINFEPHPENPSLKESVVEKKIFYASDGTVWTDEKEALDYETALRDR